MLSNAAFETNDLRLFFLLRSEHRSAIHVFLGQTVDRTTRLPRTIPALQLLEARLLRVAYRLRRGLLPRPVRGTLAPLVRSVLRRGAERLCFRIQAASLSELPST